MKYIIFMYICLYSTSAKTITGMTTEMFEKPCNQDEECNDFRMVCHERNRVCSCTTLYDWNNQSQECQLNSNKLNVWLANQSSRSDEEETTRARSQYKFYVQAVAGMTAIVVLSVICVGMCSLAFCFVKEKDDVEKMIPAEEKPGASLPTTNL